jgi:hypothetical protein
MTNQGARAPDLPQLGGPVITSTPVGGSPRSASRLCSSTLRLKNEAMHSPSFSPASPAVAASAVPRRPGCRTATGWQTARPGAARCLPGCDACDTAALDVAQWQAKRRAGRTSAARSSLLRAHAGTPTRGSRRARSDGAATASELRRGVRRNPSSDDASGTAASAGAVSTPRRFRYEAAGSATRQATGAWPARSMASQRGQSSCSQA